MGRTFEALRRAERERQRLVPTPRPSVPTPAASPPRALWKRWLGWQEAQTPDEAALAAWLVEEMRSLAARIDALDEKLDKRLPEAEGRVHRLLEATADHLESSLVTRVRSVVVAELEARLAAAERRAALGRAGVAVVVLALLATIALR